MSDAKAPMVSIRDRIGTTLVQRPEVLDFSYVPEVLVDRTEAYNFLASTFGPLLEGPVPRLGVLYGGIGTGKTAVARKFLKDLENEGTQARVPIKTVYVNCKHMTSLALVLGEALSRMGCITEGGIRGFTAWERAQDLRRLVKARNMRLVMAIDEVDGMTTDRKDELVYIMSRLNDGLEYHEGSISVLVINETDVREVLGKASLSTLQRGSAYHFTPYDTKDARELLEARAKMAFVPGSWDEGIVDVAAREAVAEKDIRIGIEVLSHAARLARLDHVKAIAKATPAEKLAVEKRGPRILVRHAEEACGTHFGGHLEALSRISEEAGMVLLAIVKAQVTPDPVTTGQAERSHQELMAMLGRDPSCHTTFWKHLKKLKQLGLIEANRSGKGHAGTTQLINVPSSVHRALETRGLMRSDKQQLLVV